MNETTGLILCLRRDAWAMSLRRELPPVRGGIRLCRRLETCWNELARRPASFVVVELTEASIMPLFRRLVSLDQQFPQSRVAVVADRSAVAWEWVVRQAGAVHFTTDRFRLGPLAGIIRRHLDRIAPVDLTPTESIHARLPFRNPAK